MESPDDYQQSDSSSSDGGGSNSEGEGSVAVSSAPRGTGGEDHRLDGGRDEAKGSVSGGRRRRKKNQRRRPSRNSLDHLRRRVGELMATFEDRGLFIPPPVDGRDKGKVWSNRNYGQDKKRQRKASERLFLEGRITQLEACLRQHDRSSIPAG